MHFPWGATLHVTRAVAGDPGPYPLPVYLDRERSRHPVTADDSVALRRALDAIGALVGESGARWFEGGAWASGFLDRADAVTAHGAAYLSLYLRTAGAHDLHAGLVGERRRMLGIE